MKMKMDIKKRIKFEHVCLGLFSLCILLLSGLLVITSASCSRERNGSNNSNAPILISDQEHRIRERILNETYEAVVNQDEQKLGANTIDSAFDLKKGQMVLQGSQEIKSQTTISLDAISIAITKSSVWPRSYSVVSATSDTQQSESLLLFKQVSPTEHYKLASCVRAFSNITIPSFGTRDLVTINVDNLKVNPMDALKQYADLLKYNESSVYASAFENDPLKTYLHQITQTVDSQVQKDNGSQEQNFFVNDKINGIETSNGGVIVFGEINSTWIRSAGQNHYSKPLDDLEEILSAAHPLSSTISVDYLNIIALYIPPKDSSELIRPIGGERIPVRVY